MATDNSSSSLGLYQGAAEISKDVFLYSLILIGWIPFSYPEIKEKCLTEMKQKIERAWFPCDSNYLIVQMRENAAVLFRNLCAFCWLWWVKLACLPGAHPAMFCLPAQQDLGSKSDGRDHGRTGRSLTNYRHRKTRFDLRMIQLIHCQLIPEWDSEK